MADYDYTVWGVGVSAVLVLSTILLLSQKKSKKSQKTKTKAQAKPPKKLSFVEKFELTLKQVHERVSGELEPAVQAYYEQFGTLKADDRVYKFNYFQEELLKELIKLDGVELGEMEDTEQKAEFKTRRKAAIKEVQSVTRGLDLFKKEHKELSV